MRNLSKRIIITILFFAVMACQLCADILYNPTWEYWIDLPEGFTLVDKQDNDRFMFQHEDLPVDVVLAAYQEGRHADAYTALSSSLKSLGAEYDIAETDWRNTDCAVGNYDFYLDGELMSGWGVAAELPAGGHIVALSWCPEAYTAELNQFVISCTDALCIDRGSWYEAGPVTAFAFPAEGRKSFSTEIDGKKINFTLDASDLEADRFVVDREYAVLCRYQSSERWVEAWQRYYRQIYRNEHGRLKQAAFAIRNALGVKKTTDELAQTLLTWTQGFSYERNLTSSDYTPAVATLQGEGSDCDGRAMLLAILLHHMDAKTCIFVSHEYSHAVFGIQSNVSGAKIQMNDGWYTLGETTAPVKLGLIAATMTKTENWIGVPLSVMDD